MHSRTQPKQNSFRYPVRMAVIDLDAPPPWWSSESNDNLTAHEARQFSGTTGTVKLLTNPPSARYSMNPISVYYCYNEKGDLEKGIAEVTNTPWGGRVTFCFSPDGEAVPKALHVSPLMDMEGVWVIKATDPRDSLHLSVRVEHPRYGRGFFVATLDARLSDQPTASNEQAGLGKLLRYGFQPQRTALLIYWQALVLLWKGVPFYAPPSHDFQAAATKRAANPKTARGQQFVWRDPQTWPWNAA